MLALSATAAPRVRADIIRLLDLRRPLVLKKQLQSLLAGLRIQTGMQAGGSDSPSLQRHHLVFHQRHQRRNHHHQALANKGRQLITE